MAYRCALQMSLVGSGEKGDLNECFEIIKEGATPPHAIDAVLQDLFIRLGVKVGDEVDGRS